MPFCEAVVAELINTHYKSSGRPFRCCHARDLLRQVKHYCEYKEVPIEMTAERFEIAVENYFGVVR